MLVSAAKYWLGPVSYTHLDVYKRQLQGFAQFGSDLDADTKSRLAQGERIVEILKQDRNSPIPVEKQVAILYATVHGYLKDIAVKDIAAYELSLIHI